MTTDTTRLARLIVPPATPLAERLTLVLFLQTIILLDDGEAWWREGFETYTCSTGIMEGGRS